jgi:hypothetical protein
MGDGTADNLPGHDRCEDWTSSEMLEDPRALQGVSDRTDTSFTANQSGHCYQLAAIYCFQTSP